MARMQKVNVGLERDIEGLIKVMESLPAAFTLQERKEILENAAQPIVDLAKELAPKSKKTHYMYAQGHKLVRGMRAPKGMGKVSAVFQPGNLSRSIQILKHGPFRRSPHVYIGPRYPNRRGGGRNRAPYAHMVEFGTVKQDRQPYMRPAFEQTKNIVFNMIKTSVKRKIDQWEQKNKQP